jgi:phosphatidate cytidylyltransferase
VTVADADPVSPRNSILPLAGARNNFVLRIVSSLVLAPLAFGAAYAGGLVFLAFWTIAAAIVLWEWDALVCTHDRNTVFTIGSVAIVGTGLLWTIDRAGPALVLITLGLFGVASIGARIRRGWCVIGLGYAGILLIAPLVLRDDQTHGFAAILFLFAVVWMTDITAYFVGRALGGPKLMPGVSPNKTWSGAFGGLIGGAVGGLVIAKYFAIENLAAIVVVACVLSVVSQIGDLVESAIKRQFNAKDASWLIPGHGGLMDRLDGFLTAGAVAVLIGLGHGGIEAPGRGLLVW